ncbi:unnamed protein product [Onchocerca flexuosa]|uniref:NADH dehydrogenase subunit 4L n=1 Tax=Onchocerca flexuosa TaxID=387005 RepID=A0A183HUY2_9BILA|nr:unnamed protein product [Onchocerca flexuosa]
MNGLSFDGVMMMAVISSLRSVITFVGFILFNYLLVDSFFFHVLGGLHWKIISTNTPFYSYRRFLDWESCIMMCLGILSMSCYISLDLHVWYSYLVLIFLVLLLCFLGCFCFVCVFGFGLTDLGLYVVFRGVVVEYE